MIEFDGIPVTLLMGDWAFKTRSNQSNDHNALSNKKKIPPIVKYCQNLTLLNWLQQKFKKMVPETLSAS